MAGADTTFDLLSDPVRLPEYVPTLRLEDSIAIEGDADADDEAALAERGGAAETGYLADRPTRTISWARPDHDYAGSIIVAASTASTATVTVRIHVRDDADQAAVSRAFEDALSKIRSLVMRR